MISTFGTVTKGLLKGLQDLEITTTLLKTPQNSEKSPGVLMSLKLQ